MTHSEDFESIQPLDIGGICSSSFNIFLGVGEAETAYCVNI